MLDLAVRGGHVIDGSGRAAFRSDVGIRDDRVVELEGNVSEASSTIDAAGRVVCPGFIDVHSHSDVTLLVDPLAQSKVRQGITTEIIGNCGFGVAPIRQETLSRAMEFWKRSGSEWYGLTPTWRTMAEYLETLEQNRISLNVACLAAHGTIRFFVMGEEPAAAKDSEIDEMKRILQSCMEAGCCGFSTGLRYKPGCYAERKEVVELCKVVAKYRGVYTTHLRSEGDNGEWADAVNEAIETARDSGVSLQISHLKALTRNVWNSSPRILKLCEKARKEGVILHADQYPYDGTETGIGVFMPASTQIDDLGGITDETRDQVLRHIANVLNIRGGPERTSISICLANQSYQGKTIGEIAKAFGIDPAECILRIMEETNGQATIISRSLLEDDIRRIMKSEYVMVGSDGYSLSPHGLLGSGKPHPRSYGTFPRVLGKYVRKEKILSLEAAVRKMTSLPAEKFSLAERGLIRPGYHADLVIFDPYRIQELSTFQSPAQFPEGVDHVLVNGQVVISAGKHTEETPGRVLSRTQEPPRAGHPQK